MTAVRRKIWITRTQPGAEATADRVRALGHDVIVSPLLDVRPLEDVRLELDGVGALAFTSANAVRAFANLSADRALRVFAVGEATAFVARQAGFKTVLHTRGDVAALARGILDRRRDVAGDVLQPGATEPAGDLVGALERLRIPARAVAVYETVPADASPELAAALPDLDDVLIHSAKAAGALAALLKFHPAPRLRALGLSKAALAPLARSKLAERRFPAAPLERDLLNLIDNAS